MTTTTAAPGSAAITDEPVTGSPSASPQTGILDGRSVTTTTGSTAALPTAPSVMPGKGSIGIAATPSKDKPVADSTMSGFSQNDHPNTFSFEYETTWKGKRYILSLRMPIKDPQADRTAMQHAASELAKLLVEDLKKKLDEAKGAIQPGQNIQIVFDKDGYLAFVVPDKEKNTFDPQSRTKEDIRKDYGNTVVGETEDSKVLCMLIESGDAAKIQKGLLDQRLATLRTAAIKSERTSSGAFRPAGLVNPSSTRCFFNTAFQQWIMNPIIREELLTHPSYFVYKNKEEKTVKDKCGKAHPLYVALLGYDAHQRAGKVDDAYNFGDLPEELGITNLSQDDVDVALRSFEAQLDFNRIPEKSPLYSLTHRSLFTEGDTPNTVVSRDTQSQDPPAMASIYVNIEAGKSLGQLTSSATKSAAGDVATLNSVDHSGKKIVGHGARFKTSPSVLTVGVHRTIYNRNNCPEEKKRDFIQALFSHKPLNEACLRQLFDDAQFEQFNAKVLPANHELELADAILFDATKLELVRKIILQEELNKVLDIPTAKDQTAIKVDSLEITLPKEVCGEETTYDLMSYGYHDGTKTSSGHWVAYVRDLKDFWRISDGRVEPIDETIFLTNAGKASSYVLNKKGITPIPNAKSGSTEPKPPAEAEKNELVKSKVVIEDGKGGNTQTTLIVEMGTLGGAGPDFALVNPTSHLLQKIHRDFSSVEPNLEKHIRETQTAKVSNRLFKGWRTTISYSPGTRRHWPLPDSLPDVEQTKATSGKHKGVLHVVLPDAAPYEEWTEGAIIKNAVKAVLKKAMNAEIRKVAFPVFDIPALAQDQDWPQDKIIDTMKMAIIEFAKENEKELHAPITVKIIVPPNKSASSPSVTAKPEAPVIPTEPTKPFHYPVRLGKYTTFSLDTSGNPLTHKNTGVDQNADTLAKNLKEQFDRLKERDKVEFDFTGANPQSPTSFHPGYYGFLYPYEEAIEVFQKQLRSFAEANTTPNIHITLKVPKGTTFDFEKLTGSIDTSAPATAIPKIRSNQRAFLEKLRGGTQQTIGTSPTITVIPTTDPVPLSSQDELSLEELSTTPRPLSQATPEKLMERVENLAKNTALEEIVIDCRPGADDHANDSGVVALDYRYCGNNSQRLRNFIAHLIDRTKTQKPIKIILPQGSGSLPAEPNVCYTLWEYLPFVSSHPFFTQAPKA